MPAERSHALGRLLQLPPGHGGVALAVRLQVDAHPANTGRMHVGKHADARHIVDDGDATRAGAQLAHGVDRAGIVGAVGTRMHDHHPLDV